MSQFYFALTNPEAESLLKEEVKQNYPELRLSYSRPGFLTFKGERPVTFKPLFARVAGPSIGKMEFSNLKFDRAWVWKRSDDLEIPEGLKQISDRSLFKIGEKVTLIMMVGTNEYWVGEYELLKTHFQTPGEVSSIPEEEVPSRAYYKLAEAQEAFDLPFDHQERVLELGSAPGGASQFLLEQDTKVLGVDPAEMDARILKNSNFRHLRRPFESVGPDNFGSDIDWIVSDINLPPTVVFKEVQRFLSFLNPRGLVLTLKMNEDKHLKMLPYIRSELKNHGFTLVEFKYLPSHRREIALIALR
jgi:23S rRNA (cytidine2498-2'-O)-methyltransferase